MPVRNIAFVVPRYGVQSAGGAEVLAQRVAEKLAATGARISVLTTCARDHFTWANYFPPGQEFLNGVAVHRFPADERSLDSEFISIQGRIAQGMEVGRDEEKKWIRGSVHSHALYEFIRTNRNYFDAFIFIPYLFGTTWAGSAIAPEKSIIIPCLHDEPYARLGVFREMFGRCRGLIFNSEPERDLARGLYGLNADTVAVGGMGLEPRDQYRPERFRKKFRIAQPFILYAGRREEGKNTPLLIEYFRTFKRQNRNDLALVLLGTGDVMIPEDAAGDIHDLGYIAEDFKHDAYAASLAICQPSVNESFSIVLMEAWLAGAAGLAHGGCAVTARHCLDSNGGLLFHDYYTFEECILYLLEHKGLRDRLAAGGRAYVQREYSWDAVLKGYDTAFAKFGF